MGVMMNSMSGVLTTSSDLDVLLRECIATSEETIRSSTTLPPKTYTSAAFYQFEIEHIFKREWLCVGHVSQVEKVGDFFTLNLFGEPIVIVRSKDGIRALSTVCRHRWAPIVEGSGSAAAFSCPLHKWTYDLNGVLIGAPLMNGVDNFDKKTCRLPQFRSEVVADLGLIFVTFDAEEPSISDRLSTLCQRAVDAGYDMKDQVVVHSFEQDNAYNWKIQVETYAECYHHIGGHAKTLERALPAAESWCEDDKGEWTVCNVNLTKNLDRLDAAEREAAASFAPGAAAGDTIGQIVLAYPATLMTFMNGGCDIRILMPTSASTTRSIVINTRRRADADRPDFAEWLKTFLEVTGEVNEEDNDINDLQQIGVTSAFAATGRLSHLEACVWHLAQYVRRRVKAVVS